MLAGVVLTVLSACPTCVAEAKPPAARLADSWGRAHWIWQKQDGPPNTWMCFRKSFTLGVVPRTARARIAVDSKYWLWVNGRRLVFEGGLKRGPNPTDTYYDELDLTHALVKGTNTVAVLVRYFGRGGSSHEDSGKGGLVFEAKLGSSHLSSDRTWKVKRHPAYVPASGPPSWQDLCEDNVGFDARLDMAGWPLGAFDDRDWEDATEKGRPPVAPWCHLVKRPIPFWRVGEIRDYADVADVPKNGAGAVVKARLPHNAQVTPYLKVDAPAGLKITICGDNYSLLASTGLKTPVKAEYTTRAGVQEWECLGWISGHEMRYTIPAGIRILRLAYRESGYDTEFLGQFHCDNEWFNRLWEMSRRTVYLCMRDNFMDCPDRERSQFAGDAVNELGEALYAFDGKSHLLIRKFISNIVSWQRADKTFLTVAPPEGAWREEIAVQLLAFAGPYGLGDYYAYTGDVSACREAYPHIKDYLLLWKMGRDGLVESRGAGYGGWLDNGLPHADRPVIENAWYALALQTAIDMSRSTGHKSDVLLWERRPAGIRANFNRTFWNGQEYRSKSQLGDADDRAAALAVLAGFADRASWPKLRDHLRKTRLSSPYMERFVLEALFRMHSPDIALSRMGERWEFLRSKAHNTTLWENFGEGGTHNHGWSGSPLIVLSKYVAGVAPEEPGYRRYHILPQMGSLTNVHAVVPSSRGNIVVTHTLDPDRAYQLELTSPSGTEAIVGVPKPLEGEVSEVRVDGRRVWPGGDSRKRNSTDRYLGDDDWFLKFRLNPGQHTVRATYRGKDQHANSSHLPDNSGKAQRTKSSSCPKE